MLTIFCIYCKNVLDTISKTRRSGTCDIDRRKLYAKHRAIDHKENRRI